MTALAADKTALPGAERPVSVVDFLPKAVEIPPSQRLDGGFVVEVIRSDQDWGDLAAAWDDLAQNAAEPNVFYERWNVEAALDSLPQLSPAQFLCVYRDGRREDTPRTLCGLIPVVESRYYGLPVRVWELWGHNYTFLRTPLLRKGHEQETLDALLEWSNNQPGIPSLLSFPVSSGDGPFAQALTDVFERRGISKFLVEEYTRAFIRRSRQWQDDLALTMSNHHRRELRRLWRRLSEQGNLSVRHLDDQSDLESWTSDFLRLEADGWKGDSETALASTASSRDYFQSLARRAFDRGQFQMLGLFLNGVPIALKVNLLTGNGGCGFKIAYDERYAKYSPGVHLELEFLRTMNDSMTINWMDSCAVSNHFMINRLWKDRRTIRHILIPMGRWKGNLILGSLNLLRYLKRAFRPLRIDSNGT